jgi:hypothetical protein
VCTQYGAVRSRSGSSSSSSTVSEASELDRLVLVECRSDWFRWRAV